MKKNDQSALADIEQLRREMVRLDEAFRIEKDEVLIVGTRDALIGFRERSLTYYQSECWRISTLQQRIVSRLIPGEEWSEAALEASMALQKKIDESLGRFIGTPNRLMRNADIIERLSPGRSRQTSWSSRDGLDEDFDLVDTDPPIPCPLCGSTLRTDREFSLISCPRCGARESLEPEPPGDTGGGEERDGDRS